MKAELRQRMRALRRQLDPRQRAAQAIAACRRLEDLAAWRGASTVGLYSAIRAELDPAPLAMGPGSFGKTKLYPRVLGKGQALEFAAGERIEGTWGILEPTGPALPLERIDLIVVPGLAFDERGGRLGQGGGFYDRTLALTPAFRVGLCFDEQLLQRVPMEAQDAWMDAVVWASGVSLTGARSG